MAHEEDTINDLKYHFYVMEKFCDFFTLELDPLTSDVLIDNFALVLSKLC